MSREPLFREFDAGWALLVVLAAFLLAYAFVWLAEAVDDGKIDEPDPLLDDPEVRRRCLEDDARRTIF